MISRVEMFCVSLICSGSYMVTEYIATFFGQEYDLNIFDLPALRMVAFLGLFIASVYMIYSSMLFIGAAILNNTRRMEMHKQLTTSLDLVIENK